MTSAEPAEPAELADLSARPHTGSGVGSKSDWIFARRRDGKRPLPLPTPIRRDAHRVRGSVPASDGALMRCIRGSTGTRLGLCGIAARVVEGRTWRPLGFVRMSDYCEERPGISTRGLQEMARVHQLVAGAPGLGSAFRRGEVGWGALRVMARLGRIGDEDARRWLSWARALSLPELSGVVSAEIRRRARESGSAESTSASEPGAGRGVEDDEDEVTEHVPIRCTRRVRAKWAHACELTRRVVGRRLPVGECADVIAAEVSSGLRIDPAGLADLHEPSEPGRALRDVVSAAAVLRRIDDSGAAEADDPPAIEAEIAALAEGLDGASAFELDRRLRRALGLERTFEARMGPLLRAALEGGLHRRVGYWDRDRYVEERLGLCARKARALLRIERVAARTPGLEMAYRTGRLSWVQTQAVVSLVEAGLPEGRLEAWLQRAEQVSARRLTDDVRLALDQRDTDPEAFARTGGLSGEVPSGGEEEAGRGSPGSDRQTVAHEVAPENVQIGFRARPEVGRFFRCVLDSVRLFLAERSTTPVSEGQALEAMLDHVVAVWCMRDGRERAHHRILARDGYRCATPGCSSYRNLEVHHIVFRSEGGSDDPENLVTLCAWHHQKALHGGLIRCWGKAPDQLHFALGLRQGRPPLVVYGPGEVIVSRADTV